MFKKAQYFIFIIVLLLAGCTGKAKEELLKDGIKLLNENNPNGAIIVLKNALEKDKNYFEARLHLAKAYNLAGKADSAEKELQKVLRQDPASKDAHIELAKVYIQKSTPDDALKTIADYVGGNASNNADVLEIAGWAYAMKGEYTASLSLLKKAVSSTNPTPTAPITLAKVYIKMDRTQDAKSIISEILSKEPANRSALYILAELQTKENNIDAAMKTYGQITKNYPSDVEAFLKTGLLFIEKGNYDETLSISEKLVKTFPKRPEGYRLKGIAFFYKKNFNDAVIALQKSLSMQHNVAAYYFLGLSHYYKNEFEQALNQFQKALEFNPSFVQARIMSSIILLKKNRADDAIKEIKIVLEGSGKNAFAHNVLGSAYMAKGMYSEGIEELNKAIESDPKLVDAHIKKGLFELSKGRFREAETDLKTAVEAAPELFSSRVTLASYYLKRNEFNKALEILSKGLNGQKTDAVFHNLIAEALLRQNKVAEAIKSLQKAKELNPEYDASYFNLAALYFLKNEHEKGIQELKALIGKSPDNLRALVSLAAILESKGKEDEAVKYYNQAKGTGKTEGYIEFAKYYLRKRQPDKALKILDEAIKKNPSDTAGYEFRGATLIKQKNFKEAIRNFEDMEKINPKLALPYIVNTYIQMKKPEEAMNKLKKELKKEPDNLGLMAEISRVYKIMGRKQDAIDNAKQIISKKPESSVGHIALAMIYQEDKEIEKAISVLKNALQVKDASIFMMLGNLYLIKKDYTLALDQYHKAEGIKSGNVQAIFQQGAVLHAMGKRDKAIAEYQRVLRFSQNHVPALNNLAYLYAEDNKNLSMALQLATKAYTLAPKDGFVQDTLGFVLLKNGKVNEGLSAIKKAVELVPDNPSIYYHLALAYKEQGDKGKSIESLQKALNFSDFPEAKDAKNLLARLQGDKVGIKTR